MGQEEHMSTPLWCVDDRHDTPCPQPCGACVEEGCKKPVTQEVAAYHYPEWGDENNLPVRYPGGDA